MKLQHFRWKWSIILLNKWCLIVFELKCKCSVVSIGRLAAAVVIESTSSSECLSGSYLMLFVGGILGRFSTTHTYCVFCFARAWPLCAPCASCVLAFHIIFKNNTHVCVIFMYSISLFFSTLLLNITTTYLLRYHHRVLTYPYFNSLLLLKYIIIHNNVHCCSKI